MALNGELMGTEVSTAISALTDAEKADPEKIWKKICGAIVLHLVTNNAVATSGSAAAQTGKFT